MLDVLNGLDASKISEILNSNATLDTFPNHQIKNYFYALKFRT